MTNILYLVWGENSYKNGIFQNQVIQQLHLIGQRWSGKVHALVGVPTLSYRLNKKPFDLTYYSNQATDKSFDISVRKLSLALNFYSKWFLLPTFYIGHFSFLRRYIKKNDISIVHCRSYHAALLAITTRRIFRLPIKIVFDTRGFFCEEGAMWKSYGIKSMSYRLWRRLERFMFSQSDVIVNVSDTFSEVVSNRTDNTEVETIYCSANTALLYRDAELRKTSREKLGISASAKVLTYLGALEEDGWYSWYRTLQVYSQFKAAFGETHFVVITKTDHNRLQDVLAGFPDLNPKEFTFTTTSSPQETNQVMNAADYGAAIFRDNRNEVEQIIDYSAIASKTGEYLALGLPLIYDHQIGGAAALVRELDLGVLVHEPDDSALVDSLHKIDRDLLAYQQRCVQASERFDTGKNADKYVAIYNQLET